MPYKVLIVDDSSFFQNRLKEIIDQHPDLEVVDIASNGREAIEKAVSCNPDLITMDYEMPVLNGVSAIKEIMAKRPVPILMFSSLTYEGARVTLDALAAGAVDFITKDFAEVSRNAQQLKSKLHKKIIDIIRSKKSLSRASQLPVQEEKPVRENVEGTVQKNKPGKFCASTKHLRGNLSLVILGSSTGGPIALTEILTKLPANFSLPLLLIQHMPENFTQAFSERLNRLCQIQVREAVDGDRLARGVALLAPGGKQVMLDPRNKGVVRVLPGDSRVNYKPSVDITFGSAANTYGNKTLGIVLTGMGTDGQEGARMLKQKGASIWSQDEESCVIYGMPMAVAKAQLTDCVLPLNEFSKRLIELS